MPFWDDLNDIISSRGQRRVSGQAYPAGSFPGSAAGSFGGRSNAYNTITGLIEASNRRRMGAGGGQGSFSGGIVPPWLRPGGPAGSMLGQQMQPPNEIEEILRRLEMLQDPSRYLSGQGDLESQAMAAASAQYDPVIAQLRQAMESARGRANRGRTELGRMYSALSGSFKEDIPDIQQQYAGDKSEAQKINQNLQAQIKKQYADTQAEQEAMAQRLGVEAAIPEATQQQRTDRDFYVNSAAQQGAAEQSALGQEQRGTVNYTREGGQIARYEGTNRQADLMAELADLLSQYEGKIGEASAAKNAAFVSGLGQLRSQQQESAMQMADRAAQNFMDQIQLGRALRSDEFKYNQRAPVGPVKSTADIPGRVLSLGLNNAQARGITDLMMSMLGRDPVITSGRELFGGQSIPREGMAQRIVEEGRRKGFSQQALNALMTIALEYFGRR